MPSTTTYRFWPYGPHAGADLRLAFLLLRFLFASPRWPSWEARHV